MTTTCTLCDCPAVPGDPLTLCRGHGGLAWPDFDERAWLAGTAA